MKWHFTTYWELYIVCIRYSAMKLFFSLFTVPKDKNYALEITLLSVYIGVSLIKFENNDILKEIWCEHQATEGHSNTVHLIFYNQ
jgi:hypothetical protein